MQTTDPQKDLVNKLPRAIHATHKSSRVNEISTCFEGTRTKVLDEITKWVHGDDSKSVFWLNGMAGIGKTTIARTIVDQDDDEIWVATFFFSRDDAQAPLQVSNVCTACGSSYLASLYNTSERP